MMENASYVQGRGMRDMPPPPTDPTSRGRAEELIQHLNELDRVQNAIREAMFGPQPSTGDQTGKRADRPPLDELLLIACQKAAVAVSEAQSLLNRL